MKGSCTPSRFTLISFINTYIHPFKNSPLITSRTYLVLQPVSVDNETLKPIWFFKNKRSKTTGEEIRHLWYRSREHNIISKDGTLPSSALVVQTTQFSSYFLSVGSNANQAGNIISIYLDKQMHCVHTFNTEFILKLWRTRTHGSGKRMVKLYDKTQN